MKLNNTSLRLERLAEALSLKARLRRQKEMAVLVGGQRKDYAIIPLLHGKYSKIDWDDFDRIDKNVWTCSPFGYAISRIKGSGSYMHRVVMRCPKGKEVDHKNKNRLDNRKCNLRICNKRQQQGNRWKSKHAKTSKYKGVSLCRRDGKFIAYGREGKMNKNLGTFTSQKRAALAYDAWASKYFGEFARLNFP